VRSDITIRVKLQALKVYRDNHYIEEISLTLISLDLSFMLGHKKK